MHFGTDKLKRYIILFSEKYKYLKEFAAMDEGLGGLIGICIILYLIYLFLVYVVSFLFGLAAIILAVFGLIGSVIGFYYGIRNFAVSVHNVRRDRRSRGRFKSTDIQNEMHDYVQRFQCSDFVFEECSEKNYFLGPCLVDIWNIIKGAFTVNFRSLPDFSRGNVWLTRICFILLSLCQLITQVVLGTAATAVLSLLMIVVSVVLTDIIYIVFEIVLLVQNIYLKIKSVSFRCRKCTHTYKIPVYCCPKCGINHVRLRPGRYGIFKRKCICGTKLPLTVNAKGKYFKEDSVTGAKVWTKFKMADMDSRCPHCGHSDKSGITHPISVALIGGSLTGKTTFKVAFLRDFLSEEIEKYNIKYSFPDSKYEREFIQIESYYSGTPIPITLRGTEYDIITFSFFLKHRKFGVDRLVHLYDMPSETFQYGDAQEGWSVYTFNDGIVFLIDPYSLPEIRAESQDEIKDSSIGFGMASINELIESLIFTLRQEKTSMNRRSKYTIPIALTINKVDSVLLKHRIGEEAIKKLMTAYPDVFDDKYFAMDYLCRCFLDESGYSSFIANLDVNFETVHFFSSSPIGSVPKEVKTPFHPINVMPVMQWLMIKADAQLASVWKSSVSVKDLSDEQKELYQNNKEYYNTQIKNTDAYV